jgi:hypothetical protein
VINTSDEPTGGTSTLVWSSDNQGLESLARIGTSAGNGVEGFNYRTADGSPFGNAWYGVTNAMTLTVAATGTFTQSSWSITGGAVTWSDPNFACAQGGFGGDSRGTLCSASTTGGGFQPTGGHLGWGMDPDGNGTGSLAAAPITVTLDGGGSVILAGMIASLSIDALGNVTSGLGEFRRASGSSPACLSNIVYNTGTGKIGCGSLTAGRLSIAGSAPAAELIPAPAAGWLIAPALLAVGRFVRRRKAAA